jgi:hypothetical protein
MSLNFRHCGPGRMRADYAHILERIYDPPACAGRLRRRVCCFRPELSNISPHEAVGREIMYFLDKAVGVGGLFSITGRSPHLAAIGQATAKRYGQR